MKFIVVVCMLVCGLNSFAADSLRIKEMEQIARGLIMPDVRKGDSKITFPQVPAGYRLVLRGTDRLPVVDVEGNIAKPLVDADVLLYFQLQDEKSEHKQDVPNLKVTIKGEKQAKENANSCPVVIPELREWVGMSGKLTLKKEGNIVLDPAYESQLREGAQLFAGDLKELAGWDYKVKTGTPADGDIYMTLQTEDKQLGEEGYRLNIGDLVKIEAVAAKGAFWATRSVLQMIQQQGMELVKGEARDYPKYERRGFVFDVARKFFRLNFLQDYIKIMSYYKMNDFHVHLNDNAFVQYFDNDWDKTYSAFRLESDTYPGLTAKDGSYTKKEFTALQRQGMSYGVNVFPEIDIPAHSLAFTHYKKSLGSTEYGMDHLDLSNPEVYEFFDALFKEYLEGPDPVFVGPEVHIGTDEYSKKEAESFRRFTDHYLRYIQQFGKRARLWGALTHAEGTTPVTSKDVIMNAWYNGYADPAKMIELGYDLISTPDGWLYIVPAAGYYYDYLDLENIYKKWEPNQIGNQVFPFGHPQVLGGAFAVWNDHSGNGITEKDVHHRAFPAMQVLAEKMWTGKKDTVYADFAEYAASMIEAPGINIMGKVKSADELVMKYLPGQDAGKDLSGNGYDMEQTKGVKMTSKDGMVFNGKQEVILPVEEIGYDYTVVFDLCVDKDNAKDAILFRSPNAVVILNDSGSGKLAFMRDGYRYNFDYVPAAGKWEQIAIQGDAKGTSLYVNGKLVQKLQGNEKVVKDLKGRESKMYIQQTLVFPLQQIGDAENGFKGKMKSLTVYNKKRY